MISIAPTGFPAKSCASKAQHTGIEEAISNAIQDIVNNSSDITFNLSHPDTLAALRSFDRFFSHGFVHFLFQLFQSQMFFGFKVEHRRSVLLVFRAGVSTSNRAAGFKRSERNSFHFAAIFNFHLYFC